MLPKLIPSTKSVTVAIRRQSAVVYNVSVFPSAKLIFPQPTEPQIENPPAS